MPIFRGSGKLSALSQSEANQSNQEIPRSPGATHLRLLPSQRLTKGPDSLRYVFFMGRSPLFERTLHVIGAQLGVRRGHLFSPLSMFLAVQPPPAERQWPD